MIRVSPGPFGLALGSGAARGWAHIGVLRVLEEADLAPSIVCGSSIGSVVAAFYAAGELDLLESWARELERRSVIGYLDISLRGGLIKARRVFDALAERFPDRPIASLPKPFGAVATDLVSGHEVWLRAGSTLDALRASTALPGLVTPFRHERRWLVDGGLVNPVPVSLCRAMGAETVLAVDLNTTLLERRRGVGAAKPQAQAPEEEHESSAPPGSLRAGIQELAAELRKRLATDDAAEQDDPPSIHEVMANSINIMQVRITRSRMAGDPPDLLVVPRLRDFALLDFDRADEAIAEGRRAAARTLADAV